MNWGWVKVLAEPSMFWTRTKNGVARVEVNNVNFLVTAPTQEDLEALSAPLIKAWKIKIQKLTQNQSITLSVSSIKNMPKSIESQDEVEGMSFQYVRQKTEKLPFGGIQISNPKSSRMF